VQFVKLGETPRGGQGQSREKKDHSRRGKGLLVAKNIKKAKTQRAGVVRTRKEFQDTGTSPEEKGGRREDYVGCKYSKGPEAPRSKKQKWLGKIEKAP